MSNKQFLGKLLQKLKVGDSRTIHLNALPGNYARLDLYDLVNIEPSLHLKFIHLLLSKPSFSFSITIDPGLADKKPKEEADIIRKMVRRLNLMSYQEQDEYLEHGTRTFGFGFPLLIKRDPANPKKILKAPLFIWQLDLQKDTHRNNTWTISRKEEEHPLIFNEMLRTHLESAEQVYVDDLVVLADEDLFNEKSLVEACRLALEKLGGQADEKDLELKVLPGSDRTSIEKITGDRPWIRWSGIFGLYKAQKQSIIKDIEWLISATPGFDYSPVFGNIQQENLTPVTLDPSQEAVLNSLGSNNKIIIQGPPGTGKSQTLTAIITNALYNSATCLVVCEKRTALEVLQQNLEKMGLGELCVVIDDIHADRQKVVGRVREITDNPPQEPPFRMHEHEQLRSEYLQLRIELNRHLGIVNNRFFGDDNWLDLVGSYLETSEKTDSKALKDGIVKDLELDYKEYTEWQQVADACEKAFRKVKFPYPAIELSAWWYIHEPAEAISILKDWNEQIRAMLAEHLGNSGLYGADYSATKGWPAQKVQLFAWAVSRFKDARIARDQFLSRYREIAQQWMQKPLLSVELPSAEEAMSLSKLAHSLEKVLSETEQVVHQYLSHAAYFNWRHFVAQQPLPLQQILFALAGKKAENWKDIFSNWYTGKVLEKAARLFDLNDTTDELAAGLEKITPAWQDSLTKKILFEWHAKRREVLRSRNLTYIKSLYNLRRNKQYGQRNSLRKILHADKEIFSACFPVVLVNPVVCSSVFPLEAGLFDIVLLDEASQLRLEDTFPALLRGKVKVVSGDRHQMPPSGFFRSQVAFMDLGEDDEETEDEETMVAGTLAESESLLEFANDTDFSMTYLDFHYRSRHPDLIQFSNAAFYGSRLVPMPAKQEYTAIKFHAINGQYDGQGVNRSEAEAIATYLFEEIQLQPTGLFPSVGVGTFNINQRNLVWDMVMERAYHDEAASQRLDMLLQSGLFIKNLENIQGDERDIMLLSTTFGPNEQGQFRQQFGPLTQSKGYQLLNVIVTRAKEQVHIFSSFPDSFIATYQEALQEKGNTGKGILYAYLAYARAISSGNQAMQDAILNTLQQHAIEKYPEKRHYREVDKFRIWLNTYLEQHLPEYTIAVDYPFGGFALDLAVLDAEGKLLLAIACEGSPFDGTPEAYRNHLFRRQMLLQQSITVYFAWSFKWWKDTGKELERLKNKLA
jgi:hypothetical protein